MFNLPAPEPAPDFSDEVERQLRIADGAKAAERMWAEIMHRYSAYAATLVFVPPADVTWRCAGCGRSVPAGVRACPRCQPK